MVPAAFSTGNFGHLNTSAVDSSSSSSASSQRNYVPQFTFEGLLDFSFPSGDSTENLALSNGFHQPTETDKLDFTPVEPANTSNSCQQSSTAEQPVQTSLLARSNDGHTEREGCVLDLSQANAELYQHLVAVKKAKHVPQIWPIDQTLLVSHRLLRTLSTLPDNIPFQNDGGTILLIFSCYTRLLEIHTALFENLGTLSHILVDNNLTEPTQTALPSLRIGAFELDAQSDTYLSFLMSLAESLLIQARSAVLRISGGIQNRESMTVSINTRMVTAETEEVLDGSPKDSWQLDGLWRSLAASEQTYRELKEKASKAWLRHGE
ncbi:hypothetical protein F4678DRAFT_427955 [Xylaria arbuscula]|nr:hypothetical protein F4678DRAFT_427955 [Xylaria arbuscula]